MSEETEEKIEKRLTSMEKILTYMEDFERKLQEVLVQHTQTISELKSENRRLRDQIKEVYDSLDKDIPDSKPPHY